MANSTTTTSTPTRQWESDLTGISNLRFTSSQVNPPTATQILVKILTVSLNYKDGETINGFFKHHASSSTTVDNLVPCSDAVGTIVALGENVTTYQIGERVLSTCFPTHITGQVQAEDLKSGVGSGTHGVLTEYRIFEEWAVVRIPGYLSDEEACTFTIAGCTAWMALHGFRPFGSVGGTEIRTGTGEDAKGEGEWKGQTVLIQGTGGVSIFGLQIAKASGMNVIITSSSDTKLERARALGADFTINYRATPRWDDEVLRLTGGKGVDIILENGGAQTTSKSFNCIAFGGRIASIGYVSGKMDPEGADRMNINVRALLRNFTLQGILNGPRDRLEELMKFAEEKQLRPVVDKVFPFEQAREALEYLWRGEHFGKVVIKVAG